MKEECWLLLAFQGQVTQTLFRCEWCYRGGGCSYSLPSCIMRCVCVCLGEERGRLMTLMLSRAQWWRRVSVEVWDLASDIDSILYESFFVHLKASLITGTLLFIPFVLYCVAVGVLQTFIYVDASVMNGFLYRCSMLCSISYCIIISYR